MNGLVIQENNNLIDRPIMFSNGELKEKDVVVPDNMDRMYLKFETVNNAAVSIFGMMDGYSTT